MGTRGSIGYKTLSLFSGMKPDYVDITSDTTIYEGYWNGTNYTICRIDLCTDIITRTWATGDWEDRGVLLPPCNPNTTTTTTGTTTTTTELPV